MDNMHIQYSVTLLFFFVQYMRSTLCIVETYIPLQEGNNYGEIGNVCFATFCVDAETMPGCPSKGLRRHITTPSTYLEI